MNVTISDLLDLSHTLAGDYLRQFQYPWEALDGIKDLILSLGSQLSPEEYSQPQEHVWVHKTAVVAPTAYLGAPCIIGPETEVGRSSGAPPWWAPTVWWATRWS